MKIILLILLNGITITAVSQTKKDTIQKIQNSLQLMDLYFTDTEADSMIDNIRDYNSIYQNMHKSFPSNELVFPFAFRPEAVSRKNTLLKSKTDWHIPLTTQLPKNINDLAFFSIPELAALIKTKKITSVDLTRFFLGRLKKWGDTLECVISLTEALAYKEAKQADEDLKNGIYHGPLHGIPYGLKDLFAVKGYKTTWGTTPYKEQVLDEEAYVYLRLKEAGAVLCAKLSLGALAYNNKWFGGETKNPWNLKQGSSGSSAGSAAATAAGLLPFAIGTETLGSIISPSARCGATGLRPTFGSVSRSGAMVLCWSLDKTGPICRSAEDAAIVFSAIQGTDGRDPSAQVFPFQYSGKTDWKKLRIAYAENYFKNLKPDAQEWNVVQEFRSMGANIQAIEFPDKKMYPVNFIELILGAESAAAFDPLTRDNRDDLIERQDKNFWPNTFRSARTIPAVEYINANRYRSVLCNSMNRFMKDWDVLIVPSFAGSQLTITNLTGHPAVCMPSGFNAAGSPVSITLIGNLYEDATILSVANAYQNKTNFNKKHPAKFLE